MNLIITGASSGIGRAIAVELASDKNHFYLTGRNKTRLLHTVQLVKDNGGVAYYGMGDVRNETEVKTLYFQAVSTLTELDVLVVSAGVGYLNDLDQVSTEEFDLQFDTNVKGTFLWLREVLPHMKRRNAGQIVIISSTAGFQTFEQGAIYCATKHAVQAIADTLRKDLIETNIKVATINPGGVNSPWFDHRTNFTAFNRDEMLTVEDVARAARSIITQSETSNIAHLTLTSH